MDYLSVFPGRPSCRYSDRRRSFSIRFVAVVVVVVVVVAVVVVDVVAVGVEKIIDGRRNRFRPSFLLFFSGWLIGFELHKTSRIDGAVFQKKKEEEGKEEEEDDDDDDDDDER